MKTGFGFFKLKFALFTIVLVVISNVLQSQNTFEKYYDLGGSFTEFGYCVTPSYDGGFVIAGRQGININTVNLLLMKIDSVGQIVWYKSYGSTNTQTWSYAVKETVDSGYILTGLHSDINGTYSVYAMRTNSLGDTLWTKGYIVTGLNAMVGSDILEAADSGYVLMCDYVDDIDSNWALQLIRLTSQGDTMWTKCIRRNSGVISGGLSQTADGGYIIAGTINPSGNDNSILLVKTDEFLDTVWCKELVNPNGLSYILNRTRCVQQTSDGGYFVCGTAWDINNSTTGVLMIKTDNNGDTLWKRIISNTGTENGSGGGFQTSDNGFIVCGGSGASGNGDALLIKTNNLGIPQWNSTFGGINNDLANSVISTNGGGFLICGMETSWGDGSGVYVVRTDSSGFAITSTSETEVADPHVISIYPNPVNNTSHIDLGTEWYRDGCFVRILDLTGRVVLEIKPEGQYVELNAQKLNAGIYVCAVSYLNTQLTTSVLFIVE